MYKPELHVGKWAGKAVFMATGRRGPDQASGEQEGSSQVDRT